LPGIGLERFQNSEVCRIELHVRHNMPISVQRLPGYANP
jgi:hypothetical protein